MPPATQAGARPQPLAVRPSHRDVLLRLRSAQKPAGRGAPAYSLYVNRPLGRQLAAVAFRAGATPNQVTAVSAVLTFTAIALIAALPPSVLLGLAAALLLAAGYALDSADGQLARLRGGGTAAGEWLDHVVDAVKTVALHVAVLLQLSRTFDAPGQRGWLLVPLGFAVVASVSFSVFLLNDLLRAARRGTGTTEVIRTGSTPVRSLLGLPTDYGTVLWSFVLLGVPVAFLAAYSLLFVAALGYLLLALPAWYRGMAALDPRPEPVR